ncbi:ice-binding family protein [Flavobacterium yafengii]|uniref:ice-binding family protein n=1 Tax=Flavobacterium yafengii TaxID=3041253 RepID=UPI0024A8C2FB|nr:ice-binding family protein [Flavobacterium yafengii]MDI5899630.1 ice-binding family protein [Flavobacterium yafengii]MDI6048146.1 ice-binding family protein [Flavobacterium yafengii]
MKKISCVQLFLFLVTPLFVGAQVGIGTVNPDPSALLELYSNNKGLLVPRMTTAERDLIVAPADGLLIYNTSTSNFNLFDIDWNDYSSPAINYNSNLTGDITTTSKSNVVVNGMSVTPLFGGKYKVTFTSYYGNSPIVRGAFSSLDAKNKLQATYNYLMSLAVTNSVHAVFIGGGETLIPGIYDISGATSTVGTINFDGQGNPDALFVIRIGAAFATAASTNMVLLNGAKASNIFWVIEGAASMGASTILKGTVITNAGAIAIAAGADLEGRLFAITGAVGFSTGTAIIPLENSVIDLGVLSTFVFFSSTGAISNVGTSIITGDIGANLGLISGFGSPTIFNGFILNPGDSTIATSFPNKMKALGTFGIYQNGVLIPSSNKILTSTANFSNLTLQAIATILPNQAIDVRWNTNYGKIKMGNRTLTLIKIK